MKRWVTAALLSGALALTACEAEPAEPTEPSSSAPTSSEPTSAAPTTEPTGPVEPTLPPEAGGAGAKAVKAFVEYYWQLVDYAQATGDVSDLRALSSACATCDAGSNWIHRIHERGGTIRGGTHAISELSALPAPDDSGDWIAGMRMHSTAQRVSGAGDLNRQGKAGTGNVTMLVTPTASGWRVANLEVM